MFPFVDYLRNSITGSFKRNLTPTGAALASGFLIGQTRDIPVELYKNFKDSGTLHLLAVSGSNVILVITFFSFLFKPVLLSKNNRSILLIGIVLMFSLLSYGEPSVMRASLMAILVIGAGLVERRYELSNIIAVAALIILLYAPSQLFDLGFQLSFVIAWGLILMVPQIQKLFGKYSNKSWYKFVLFPFLISFVAQIFSFGLIGLYFKQIPVLSPIANLFVVPLVSFAVLGTLILLIADLILPFLGLLIGSLLHELLDLTVSVVKYFGSDSMPLLKVYDWTIFGVVCLYLILFMIPFAFFSKKNRRLTVFTVLIVLNIFVIQKAVSIITTPKSVEVVCSAIPGGTVSLVHLEDGVGDVIINGIRGKSYQIDEKILIPQLQKEKVKAIKNLFLLKADFTSLDDVLRFAQQFQVEQLYLPRSLKHSVLDQIHNLQIPISEKQLVVLQEYNKSEREQGYRYLDNMLLLEFQKSQLCFVETLEPHIFEKHDVEKENYYISNYIQDINSSELTKQKINKIICSRIEQIEADENSPEYDSSTNLLVDLYKVPEFRINLRYLTD